MSRPDSYQLHLRARAVRARSMRIAARRVLRTLHRWALALGRPMIEPLPTR